MCTDDGHENCPKHVAFYSKNKFEKLVHLLGFIIRIYHDARPPEDQICIFYLLRKSNQPEDGSKLEPKHVVYKIM